MSKSNRNSEHKKIELKEKDSIKKLAKETKEAAEQVRRLFLI